MKINFGKNLFAFTLLLLIALFMLAPAFSSRQAAKACWNNLLIECFSNTANNFPWCNPVGSGRCWGESPARPNVRSWGVQDVVYSATFSELCNNDVQSAWCVGGSRNYDPDVNPYLTNMNSWIYYGPFSLASAQYATLRFQMLCESEYLGDSLIWGVANSANVPQATVLLFDTSFSGSTNEFFGQPWYTREVDLSDLHDPDGNPASAIGMTGLYAFWWFKSNSNTVAIPPQPLDNGAFIDNVLLQWDDGLLDCAAGNLSTLYADCTFVIEDLVVNDQVRNSFQWYTCSGNIPDYPDVRITVNVADPFGFNTVILDSVYTGIVQDTTYEFYTDTWNVELSGIYELTLTIDPLNVIAESNENNNIITITKNAWPPNPPPEFTWISPNADGDLVGDQSVMLRWEAYDIGEDATIIIYYDNDATGCNGAPLTTAILEHDGPDSLLWNISNWIPETSRWPYAIVMDAQSDTCIYATHAVVRRIDAAQELPIGVPTEFFLSQNYPNPFNPQTEISFGVTKAGLVTLRVYDLLGRQVAELVNEQLTPGTYLSHFNGRDLSSGVYLYTLKSAEGVLNNKMVLLK